VLACARHLAHDRVPEGTAVLEVACTGVLNPRTVASLIERGATSVQIVGCPPGDCAYGSGNVLTSDRFEGRRRPLLAKAWTPNVSQDWVSPAAADLVVGGSTGHTSADVASAPPGWTKLLPVALVVMASVVGIRFATNASFAGEAPDATVRVIVDHRPGAVLEGHTAVMGGTEATIVVTQAGIEVARRGLPAADPIEAVVDIPVTPAAPDIQVTMVEGSTSLVLGEATVGPDIGRRLVLRAIDRPPPPDAIEGEKLFNSEGLGENLGCEVCHSVTPGEKRVGPSLAGIANTAATRVPGMSAEDYIRQSILDPNAYVVPGFPANQMLNVYSERLTPDQIDALVAYLMTLTGPAS
jgi:cytochrome c551/c552